MRHLFRGLKNTSYLIIGNVVSQTIQLFGGIYIARILGPDQYGFYITIGAFVGVFFIFTFGGLNKVVLRECSKNTDDMRCIFERTIGLRNLAILLSVLLCIIASFFTSDSLQMQLYIIIFSADLVIKGINGFLCTIYQATEEMKFISIFSIITNVLSTGFSILILYLGYGVLELLIVQLGSHLIVLIMNYKFSKRFVEFKFFSRPLFDVNIIKPSAIFSLLIFLTTIATRIDVLMIAALSSSRDVGIYGIAYKLVQKFSILRNLVTTAFFPIFVKRFYKRSITGSRIIRYSVYFAAIIAVISVFISFFSNDIIRILFGTEYMESARILSLLVFAQAFNWATIPFTTAAQATHNEKVLLFGRTLSALLNVPLNFILFNSFGLIGIAYSTLIVYAVGNSVIVIMSYKSMKKNGYIV